MTKNILVTGANGFMGKSISNKFNQLSFYNVFELMRENSIWKGEKFARVDLLSQLSTNKLLTKIQFDEIYHFAGNSSVIDSWRDPLNALIDNSKLTSNLVNAINTYSAETKLIFISSSAVYARKIGPIKELDPLGPDSPYGMSKLISELEVESVKNSLVIRPFFVIGSGKKNDLLFDWIGQIRSFKNDKKNFLEVGDLDVIRDFISVEASTDAIMQLGSSQTGIYNLGSGLSTSLIEVVDILRAISGIDFELMQNAPIKRRRGDRKEVVADVTKLNSVYKFDTQPTLTEQISLIYNSYSD
jgi:nucleoside-diphosphate-sugar epimerase